MIFTLRLRPLATLLVAGVALSGCNALNRLSDIGEQPALTQIDNPAELAGNQPLQMPMPQPVILNQPANSLWRPGSRAFFKDQRASQVGDLLTVVIEIDDSADIDNSTRRTRESGEDAAMSSLLGYESHLDQIFPDEVDPDSLIDLEAESLYGGEGTIERAEEINFRVAAMVTQVLPNGNLVIAGRQETRVNFEVRELQVAGIIRPEDITNVNTIEFDQIVEARISYGGRGQIFDVQQPRYGQQLYDIIWPW